MKKFLIIIVLAIIAIFSYKKFSTPATPLIPDNQADLILFWGEGCPHCEVVKKYIDQNGLNSKLKIVQKEIYYNKTNQQLLTDTVKKCPEINSSAGIGVPLGFAPQENKCLYGDTPITDWLKAKTQ